MKNICTFKFLAYFLLGALSSQAQSTCPPPQNLAVQVLHGSSAYISWSSGGANHWQVSYGPLGFSPNFGNIVTSNSQSYTLSGLSPATDYEVYVRDSCAAGDLSSWVGPVSFQTLCYANTAPWSENFDGSNWVSGTGNGNSGNLIGPCWSRAPEQGLNFGTRTGPTGSSNTGPSQDVSGSGNYLFTETNNQTGSMSVSSPAVFIPNSMSSPQLKFEYHMYGADIDSLVVQVRPLSSISFTILWVKIGQQQTSSTDRWIQDTAYLGNYLGDSVQFRFISYFSSHYGDIAIDEIEVRERPSCHLPIDLSANATSSSDVNLNWTSGGAGNWQIRYRASGSNTPFTILNVSTNPYTVTGLLPGTTYDFFVRDSCGTGDVSLWGKVASATTNCAPITAPWSENFDGSAWVPGSGGQNANNQIHPCWSRNPVQDPNFGTGTGATGSSQTGPEKDVSGSGNYIFSESGFSGSGSTHEITSPSIIIPNSMSNPQLKFDYHIYGQYISSLVIEVKPQNGSYTQVWSKFGEQQTSSTDPWTLDTVALNNYLGDTVQFRFKASFTSYQSDIAIDEIEVREAPTCIAPNNLTATALSADKVKLDWNSGGAAHWQIRYRPTGSTGNYTLLPASGIPFTVSGLFSNTNYDFYVRDSCGVGDLSNWSKVAQAQTFCTAVTAPWLENFDGPNWVVGTMGNNTNKLNQISPCWRRFPEEDPNFGTRSGSSPELYSGPDQDASGSGKYVYSEAGMATRNQYEIATPLIVIPSSLSKPQLKFEYHMYGADIDSLSVQIRRSDSSNFQHLTSIVGQQQTASSDNWLLDTTGLGAYLTDTVQFRFRAHFSGHEADIAIDEVEVREKPTCFPPTNLSTTPVSSSAIELSWTTGGAANWQVRYRPKGSFSPYSLIAASNNPLTVSGLLPNTAYDFFVRDSCGPGNVSAWSKITSDTTFCSPILAPWSEDFDGSDWVPGSGGYNNGNQISSCWSRSPESDPNFGTRTGPTPSSNTGPSQDASGSGNYIFTRTINGSRNTMWINPPFVVIPHTLTDPQLKFLYHMHGASIDSTVVRIRRVGTGNFHTLWKKTTQQQTSSSDPWLEDTLSLDAYLGDTVQLRFQNYYSNFSAQIGFDEVEIREKPVCYEPQNLSAMPLSSSEVQLQWNSGGAANWQVRYRPSGSSGAYTLLNAGSNPFTISGLQAHTSYDFWVRDSCDIGNVSTWSRPADTTTFCSVVTAPWSENFDGSNWVSGAPFDNYGNSIDPCWSRNPEGYPNFGPRTGPTGSSNTGPDHDVSLNGKYIFIEASGAPPGTQITTPLIAIPASMNDPQLKFEYHMYGADIDSLVVEVSRGHNGNYTRLWSKAGQQQSASTDPWVLDTVSLNSYSGDSIHIRFRGYDSGLQGDMAVDEVEVREAPDCLSPDSLDATALSPSSVQLSWNSGGANNWQIGYRLSGSTGSYTVVNAGTNPFAVNGLSSSTAYQFVVRDSCGPGNVSAWSKSIIEYTLCNITSAPWSENFDGSDWIPGSGAGNDYNEISPCWSRSPQTDPNFGTGTGYTGSVMTGPSQDVSGSGNYIYLESSNGGTSRSISSPQIHVPLAMTNPKLKFYYHAYGAGIDSLVIRVQVKDQSNSTRVWSLAGQQQSTQTDSWIEDSVSLGPSFSGDTLQFHFVGYYNTYTGDMALDEMTLDGTMVPCVTPSNLNLTVLSDSSIEASWNSAPNTFTQLTYYDVAQGVGNATTFTNVTSPYTLSGLDHSTSYHIGVQDSCINGFLSPAISGTATTITCDSLVPGFTTTINHLQVGFNSSGVSNADSIVWEFGTGNKGFIANPSHVYPSPGTYTVKLIAYNNCGDTSMSVQTLILCDSLAIAFHHTMQGDSTVFSADSSRNASGYFWDLDDSISATGKNVIVGYPQGGTKTVSLTVFNDCGDTLTLTKTIEICFQPVAEFQFNVLSPVSSGLRLQFDGTMSKNAISWNWDFGDGDSATGPQPIHIYATPGFFYIVTLVVTSECGDSDTLSAKLSQISLEEFGNKPLLELYPNPSHTSAQLEWDGTELEVQTLRLTDASGKLVDQWKVAEPRNGEALIRLDDLPPGVYWLQVLGPKVNSNLKLVVDK